MQILDASFDDVDLLCERVREWQLELRPLKPAAISAPCHLTQFTSATALFTRARFTVPLEQTGAPPAGYLTFVLLDPRMQRLWWRGHDADASTTLVFPHGGELEALSGVDFAVHTLSFRIETVRAMAEVLELELPQTPQARELFRATRHVLSSIRQELAFLLAAGATFEQIGTEAILKALLRAWLIGPHEAAPAPPDAGARARAVRIGLEAMAATELAELNPAKLRELSGVSERTLQYAFRERFGLTPAAFIKARRLAGVRTMLRRADPRETLVADVISEFGFWHVGQFAKDYRKAFGERPSETLESS